MAVVRHYILAVLIVMMTASHAAAYQQIEFVREIGSADSQPHQPQFNAPRALAAFGERLYVADTDGHRIVVLDQSGKTVLSWGMKGSKPGQFRSPSGIAIDGEGRVFVADTGNNRVQVFDGEGQLLRGFGVKGEGRREFSGPAGIAALNGVVYVADTGNSRVQVMTADGIFIRQIIAKAPRDEMKSPAGVAVDAQNRIYVLDPASNRVRVFDPTGAQVAAFGSRGAGVDGFEKPQGIAVDGRGNVYVADTGNYKIKKFDAQGKLLGSIGCEGRGQAQFLQATGLIVDQENRIWVVDAGKNTLQVFSMERDESRPLTPGQPLPTAVFVKDMPGDVTDLAVNKRLWGIGGDFLFAPGVHEGRTIGVRGSEPAMFKAPHGLAVDAQGNFWVADTGNDRLQKFSLEGNLLHVIGKNGGGEGEFRAPVSIAVSPRGNLCVADAGNKRVQVFNAKGVFLGAFGRPGKLPGQFSDLADIAVDAAENIYVVDRGNDRIAKYDSNGGLLWEAGKTGKQDGELRGPESIAISPDNEVYVLDAGNARVQVFDGSGKFLRMFGSEGSDAGQFRTPRGMALEDGLRLYVGDRGNRRVQVFQLRQTPGVPGEVTAQARANEIQLNWKAAAESYLELYRIYRAESPAGSFAPLGTSATPFYLDKNLQSNRAYHYRISSQAREGNESAPSGIVSAVTPKLVPGAPKRVRGDAQEKQVTLSWLPNLEPFVDHYRVYRTRDVSSGFELLTKTEKTLFVDAPLADEMMYYYQVTAVGREGDESTPSEVVFASTPKAALTAPPLEITKIEAGEIFASAYKYYESHPLGKVVITNNSDQPMQKIKLSFSIKDYMDYPTDTEITELAPKQQKEFPLTPLFNNRILVVTENTPLQSEVAVTIYVKGEPRTVKRSYPLTLYERHAMRWDQKAKIGAFVTHKDPAVADFSRMVVQQYVDDHPNLPQAIVYARGVYGALGVLGLKYIIDPTSPFSQFSESSTAVDYLQYPRDTIARKSGDCDDLSVLFAACMENIGIGVAFVDAPGHVFVMFNTGVSEQDKATLGFPDELLVPFQGTVWIPVEMTMVGTSFTRAWQKGAEEYRTWATGNKLDVISVQKSWDEFKPVTLARSDLNVKVKRDEIEAAFRDELETLTQQRLANLSAGYRNALKKDPTDQDALAQLGILYGESGLLAEALEQFQKLLALDKTSALALNNIGNISFLQGRLDDARQAYEAALKASPGDPGIMVNLARVAAQGGKKEEAKKLLQDAAEIDPRVLRQHPDIAAGLGGK